MGRLAFIVLLCLAFTLPWEGYWSMEGALETTSRMLGVVAFLTGVLGVLMDSPLRRPHPAFLFIGMYVAWSVASMFWSIGAEESMARIGTLVQLAILLWLVYQYANSFSRIRAIMYALIAGTIAMMYNLYLHFFFGIGPGIGEGEYRVGVAEANVNGTAFFMVLSATFVYYLIAGRGEKTGRLLKILGLGFIVAAVIGVFLTGSRAGVIGLALTVGMTMLAAIRRGWKSAAMVALCTLMAFYLVVRYVPEGALMRVQEGTEAHSFQTRLELWGIAFQAWLKTPIEGCGAGTSPLVTGHLVIHNTFLTVLLELGLVGLGLFLAMLASALTRVLSFPRAEKMLWLSVFVNFLPHMASSSLECQKVVWLIVAMILAQPRGGWESPLPGKPVARELFRRGAV